MTETAAHQAPELNDAEQQDGHFDVDQVGLVYDLVDPDPTDLTSTVPDREGLTRLQHLADAVAMSPTIDSNYKSTDSRGRTVDEMFDKVVEVGTPTSWTLNDNDRFKLSLVDNLIATGRSDELPGEAKAQLLVLKARYPNESKENLLDHMAGNARARLALADQLEQEGVGQASAPEQTPPAAPDNRQAPQHRGKRKPVNNNGTNGTASAGGAPTPPTPPQTPARPVQRPPVQRPPAQPQNTTGNTANTTTTAPETDDDRKRAVKEARDAYVEAYKERIEKGKAKGLKGEELDAYLEGGKKHKARMTDLYQDLEKAFRARKAGKGEDPDSDETTEAFEKYRDKKLNARVDAMYAEETAEPEPKGWRARFRRRFSQAGTFYATMRDKEARAEWKKQGNSGRRKVVAGVVGVALVGAALYGGFKWGESFAHHAAEQASGGTGGTPPTPGNNAAAVPTPNTAPAAHEVGTLSHKGDTMWHEIAQHKPNLHGQALHDEVQHTLDANHMDWEDAKHMGVGAHFDFLPDPSAAPAPTVSPEVQHLLDTNHITLDQAQHMSIDQLLHLVPEQTVDTGPTPAQWVMGEIAVAALVGGAYAVGRSGGKKAAQGPEAATTTKKTTETKVKKVKGAPLPGSPEAAEAANRKRKEDDEEDNKKKNKGKKKKTS